MTRVILALLAAALLLSGCDEAKGLSAPMFVANL